MTDTPTDSTIRLLQFGTQELLIDLASLPQLQSVMDSAVQALKQGQSLADGGPLVEIGTLGGEPVSIAPVSLMVLMMAIDALDPSEGEQESPQDPPDAGQPPPQPAEPGMGPRAGETVAEYRARMVVAGRVFGSPLGPDGVQIPDSARWDPWFRLVDPIPGAWVGEREPFYPPPPTDIGPDLLGRPQSHVYEAHVYVGDAPEPDEG